MTPFEMPLQGKASPDAILRPYIVHVRLQVDGPAWDKTIRYAVLAATVAEALEAVRLGLAFGDRASASDETLTDDETAELALVVGKPRMIE